VRQFVVNPIPGTVVKRRVAAIMIVKVYPPCESSAQVVSAAAAERMPVKVVAFYGPPKPFNEDVVLASSAVVHADFDSVFLFPFKAG
jgi:hypothetical protein